MDSSRQERLLRPTPKSTSNTHQPVVHIILPVHNRLQVTQIFVDCLKRQTYRHFHLILVDDGCTDGTPAFVENNITSLTILRGDGNLWWGGSLALAYRHLSRLPPEDDDVILIINDDTQLQDNYLEQLVSDDALNPSSIVVSPGHCEKTGFTEYGFRIDWPTFTFERMSSPESADALTTRGLYMHASTYLKLGAMPYRLLPHYLSDLEYTARAKRKGFKLAVSERTTIKIDRCLTGEHQDDSATLSEFLYNNLVSKRSAYNAFYFSIFALIAAPGKYKCRAFALSYARFLRELFRFIREGRH